MAGVLSVWAGDANKPLCGLLGEKGGPEPPEASEPGDRDYVCGDYMVTAEGKLLRKVKRLRKKVKHPADAGAAWAAASVAASESDVSEATATTEVASGAQAPRGVMGRVAASPVFTFNPDDADRANSVIVMPPLDLWEPIQALRREHDPAFERWMPHINMVWPFAVEKLHGASAQALAEQLRDFPPFEVHFAGFDMFRREGQASTVFLNPTDASGAKATQLYRLRERMLRAFPTLAKSQEEFHPHMTVGKVSPAEAKAIVERKWVPMSFVVKEVHMISRPDKSTPFAITETIPLGSGL